MGSTLTPSPSGQRHRVVENNNPIVYVAAIGHAFSPAMHHYIIDIEQDQSLFRMNYFAHALPFLDRPYFVAGTAVPDWLAVADRQVRLRSKHAEAFLDDADPCVAEVAGGILQHLRDDAQFHATRAFAETSLELTVASARRARRRNRTAAGVPRPSAGRTAARCRPGGRPTRQAGRVLPRAGRPWTPGRSRRPSTASRRGRPSDWPCSSTLFRRENILWDYLEDGKLLVRLNQIMRRVRLERLRGRLCRRSAGRPKTGDRAKGIAVGWNSAVVKPRPAVADALTW